MYKILYNMGMKVGIFCNKATKKFESVQNKLLRLLREREVEFDTYFRVEEIGDVDVLFVLGGDGTILKVAIEAGRRGILLLGINAGNLGFLTEFEGDEAKKAVDLLCGGKYTTESRSVLEISVSGRKYYALNDATFHRHYDESVDNNVVALAAEIDGKRVDKIVGDGIIVSTPTGSTAYSLSAGGSILTPDLAAFILTPVCAHSLHNRPVVYADTSTLRIFLAEEEAALTLYCDGRYIGLIERSDEVVLRKADFSVGFIKRPDSNFFDKLLFKLNKWSE